MRGDETVLIKDLFYGLLGKYVLVRIVAGNWLPFTFVYYVHGNVSRCGKNE